MIPRSSRTEARLDLSLYLPDVAEPVIIQGLQPLSVNWTRNRPSEPDTATVTVRAEHLPFELDIIEGGAVGLWLYEHQTPSRCVVGGPGFFGGAIERTTADRISKSTVTIQCVDYTHFPARTDLDPVALGSIDVGLLSTLSDVVLSLINLMPGGHRWTVIGIGEIGTRDTTAAFTRTKRVAERKIERAGKPPKVVAAHVRRESYLPAFFGASKSKLWDAIVQVCAHVGAICEVGIDASGGAAIFLLDAEAYQTSSDLRPFSRGGRKHRQITEGTGVSMWETSRTLLASERLPDFVEVAAFNPASGARLSARWPQIYEDKSFLRRAGNVHGSYQTAHGAVSEAACRSLARSAWLSARRKRSTARLELSQTWTDGGSPEDPDVLDLAPGAALSYIPTQTYGAAADPASLIGGALAAGATLLSDPLTRLGLSAGTVTTIRAAESRLRGTALWQADEVRHVWDAAKGYRCEVDVKRFLGAQERVELEAGAEEQAPRAGRHAAKAAPKRPRPANTKAVTTEAQRIEPPRVQFVSGPAYDQRHATESQTEGVNRSVP